MKVKPKHTEKEYIESFLEATKEGGYTLSSLGFNENSRIKLLAFRNFYKKTWIEILDMFGRLNDFYDYVIGEYREFYNNEKKQCLKTFADRHRYLTYSIVKNMDMDKLRDSLGLYKLRHSDEDYMENYLSIENKLGRPPLFNEFASMSRIYDNSYAERFGLKGRVYDNIVKMYTTKENYEKYLKMKAEYKTKVGKITGQLSREYSTEFLKENFVNIFENCKTNYGVYPTRRLFNKMSNIDDSVYRRRLNTSWGEICKQYGYPIENKNVSERITLEKISKILDSKYIGQQKWDWLRNKNGHILYVDGYYPKHNLVVEFDGIAHREPVDKFGGEKTFKKLKENDFIKDELIPKHGIKLIRIDSREKWYDDTYLKEKLEKNNII